MLLSSSNKIQFIKFLLLSAILNFAFNATIAFAVTPRLIKDTNSTPLGSVTAFAFSTTTKIGGNMFLSAYDLTYGSELWKTDGTLGGTSLVKDMRTGSDSSSPSVFAVFNTIAVIYSFTSEYGSELWVTDGTESGTSIITDLRSGTAGINLTAFRQVSDLLYFNADTDGSGIRRLWKTDGTLVNTTQVSTVARNPANFTNLGSTLYFAAAGTGGSSNTEIWKSDGTEIGTAMIKDVRSGSTASSPANLTVSTSSVFFTANNGTNGIELWKTDGTDGGTYLVKDIVAGSGNTTFTTGSFVTFGGGIVFAASNNASGTELWFSDGTDVGTYMIKDINPGTASSSPTSVFVDGSTIYFNADDGVNGIELWKSDGTEIGTVMVKNINLFGSSYISGTMAKLGSHIYFSASNGTQGIELWRTDGTEGGTTLVKDINTGSASSTLTGLNLLSDGNYIYFAADDGVNGTEPWRSDGTEEGTIMIKNIGIGTNTGFTVYYGRLNTSTNVFSANDGTNGSELWKTDGTEEGTLMIKNVAPGSGGSYISPDLFRVIGSNAFVWLNDGTNGSELWKTDGTDGETVMVKDINPGSGSSLPSLSNDRVNNIVIGSTLYFTATDGVNGVELWRSDGTSDGTYMVKDIYAGATGSSPKRFAVIGSTLYFWATDGTATGVELWKTDGTEVGTVMVKDLYTSGGQLINTDDYMVVLNNVMYFEAAIGASFDIELVRSDGTSDGTYLVKNLLAVGSSDVSSLVVSGDYIYFAARSDTANSNERGLYRSDGTSDGTVKIHEIRTTSDQSGGSGILATQSGGIYYSFDHPIYGIEIWYSDGFSTSTAPVRDINAGVGDMAISPALALYNSRVKVIGDVLFFYADDGVNGTELWKTDGTEAGTYLLDDTNPGSFGSNPAYPSLLNESSVMFAAVSPTYSYEPFVFDFSDNITLATTTVSSISQTSATLSSQITDVGFSPAHTRGFNYGTSLSYGMSTSTQGRYSLSTYDYTLTDLTCNTTYYVEAFVVNTYGTTTQTTSFTTSACDAVATPSSRRGGGGGGIRTITTPVTPSTTTPTLVTTSTNNINTVIYTRDLSFGSTGTDVIALQRFLNSRGFTVSTTGPGSPGNEINVFGSRTQAALARFQTSVGITPASGYFGPITRSFVNALGTPTQIAPAVPTAPQTTTPSQTTYTRDLFLGSRGSDVTSLQNFLIQQGYLESGYATGYFGQLTQSALIKFQQANNISPALGYFGVKTRGVVGK